jgi:hypothetical protein
MSLTSVVAAFDFCQHRSLVGAVATKSSYREAPSRFCKIVSKPRVLTQTDQIPHWCTPRSLPWLEEIPPLLRH